MSKVGTGKRGEGSVPRSSRHRRVVLDRAKLGDDRVEKVEVVEEIHHCEEGRKGAEMVVSYRCALAISSGTDSCSSCGVGRKIWSRTTHC